MSDQLHQHTVQEARYPKHYLFSLQPPLIAMKQLSQDKVNSIIVLLNNRVSVKKAAKRLKLYFSTVSKYKNVAGIEGRVGVGGRIRKITEAKLRQIHRDITLGRMTTAIDVRNALVRDGLEVSHTSVTRALKALGFVAKIKKKKPFISAANRKARLKWAKERRYWTEKDWSRVVFSDETLINIWSSDGVRYCWVRPGDPLMSHHLDLTVKHGGGGLMMWGCMIAKGLGYGCQVEESIDSNVYQDILQDHLKSSMDYYDLDVDDFIFQLDNAPCHVSKATKQWLMDNGFELLPWPAQSPDLNPIEHVWHYIKVKLSGYEHKASSIEELWKRVDYEWNEVPKEYITKLYRSMPARVQAVIDAKGGPTKY